MSILKLTWVSKGKYNFKKFITTILSWKITSTKALRMETKVNSDFCTTVVTDPENKENSWKLVSLILILSQMYSRGCEKNTLNLGCSQPSRQEMATDWFKWRSIWEMLFISLSLYLFNNNLLHKRWFFLLFNLLRMG